MRPRWGAALAAALLLAAALAGGARAASDPLPPETVLVAVNGAPAATEDTFSIAPVASGTPPDYLVTFTDLQTPAALTAANIIVTQGDSIAATTMLATPATTATVTLPAAVGQFTLRVIATPDAAAPIPAGSFTVSVCLKAAPTQCVQGSPFMGTVAQQSAPSNPAASTLSLTLTVATAGNYTITYADESFPVALAVPPTLALFQGSTPVMVPIPASPAAITLAAGTYTLLGFAQADPTVQQGLYGITVAGAAGPPLLSSSYPVGLLAPASTVSNPSAQSVSLTVTDFAFPGALASASAAVTSGGSLLGSASSGAGASSLAAPAGPLQVWSYAAAGTTAGTYEVDLTSGSASLLQSDQGVAGAGTLAFAFVTPTALAPGAYQATANDFQFPSALNSLQFAAVQQGAILNQSGVPGSVDFATTTSAPVVLLAAASPVAGGSGLFDINIQTGGNAPQLVFDQVQPVSTAGGFASQAITLAAGSYDVTLADLQFPAQLGTLALVGSSNGAVLGKIYGSQTFNLQATAGSYDFTVIAIPAAGQQYGLYGLQIEYAPPTVTLRASPTTVVAGGSTKLSWTSTGATSCTASGGTFTGTQPTGGSGTPATATVTVSATTTYKLACTGPGGTSNPQSVTVTATQPAPARSSGGGGGGMGIGFLSVLALLAGIGSRAGRLRAGR
jgi:hypothetical protein